MEDSGVKYKSVRGTGARAVLTKAGVNAMAATVVPSAPTTTTASDAAHTHPFYTPELTLSNLAYDVQTLLLFSQHS